MMTDPNPIVVPVGAYGHLRWLLSLDVMVINVAIILLAALPLDTLVVPEMLGIIGGAAALILTATHINRLGGAIPGDRWCYLVSAVLITYVMVGYLGWGDGPWYYRLIVSMFLTSGIISAIAAHIYDSGGVGQRSAHDVDPAGGR